jgi:hypothetical protein
MSAKTLGWAKLVMQADWMIESAAPCRLLARFDQSGMSAGTAVIGGKTDLARSPKTTLLTHLRHCDHWE